MMIYIRANTIATHPCLERIDPWAALRIKRRKTIVIFQLEKPTPTKMDEFSENFWGI